MKIFISGGCKNGKSAYAQLLALKMRKPGAPMYYLATMIPADGEDEARIARHRHERGGYGFETVEAGRDVFAAIKKCDKQGAFLLDSATALLANEMFLPDGRTVPDAYIKVAHDIAEVLEMTGDIIIVSDFIYSDANIYDSLTESYRRGLAYIDRQTARACDVVLEACGGACTVHKGGDIYHEIA